MNRILYPPAAAFVQRRRRKEATVKHKNLPYPFAASIQIFLAKEPPIRSLTQWVTVILTALAVICCPISARASGGGISGVSGKTGSTCTSCHSSGTPPTVTLTGPATVASGSTNTYTLSVGGTGNHGLDLAASAGTFSAGTGTRVLNGEITHSAPSTSGSWTFT